MLIKLFAAADQAMLAAPFSKFAARMPRQAPRTDLLVVG
jgi:hypothetical protein